VPTPTLPDFRAQETAIVATRWAGFNHDLLNTRRPPTPTPIPHIVAYPVKKVLLSYFSVVCCGSPFDYRGDIYPWADHIYLYTDGQLILNKNGKLWEKQLSKTEMDGMISALRQLGFFDLAADKGDNQNNSIYHFGPGDYFWHSDMLSTIISLFGEKPASLRIYEEYMKFITQPVKNVLYYLDHYNPPGLAPYEPDRVLLQVEPGRAEWVSADATAIPWPDGITPLNKQTFDGILYLEGKEASQFSRLTGNFFSYKGEEYSVDQVVIFPHECQLMVYPREDLDRSVDYQPYFYCSDP
jgi:hypothetical protein